MRLQWKSIRHQQKEKEKIKGDTKQLELADRKIAGMSLVADEIRTFLSCSQ